MNLSSVLSGCRHLVLAAASLLAGATQAAGLLTPSDGSLPELEIRDHHVEVVIEDGYVITQVDQVFHNPHNQDLEARYSFPVPEKGTVAEFTLWIDGKPVVGEVLEKQRARQIYESQKAAGNDAGLTEKDAYRRFEVMVSPVRAQADTRVRLVYMQAADIDTGMGRYVYPLEEGGVDEQKLAFWSANERVTGSFSFDLKLRSAYPVDAVRVPGRQAGITQTGAGEWQVKLTSATANKAVDEEASALLKQQAAVGGPVFQLDEDLVVYWRLKPGLPGSVDLVTHKPDANGRGTFMLVVTPGDDLKPITEGRDWVFVLDISGSMEGKYATLVDGVQRALRKLRANDRFRIVLFNNSARELTNGYVQATPQAVAQYASKIANTKPGGGTNLYRGLTLGIDALDADRTSGIVLVTDGVANVGETAQRKFIELVQQKDVRLFTLVMGNSANRPMLTAMTQASGGFALSVSNSDDVVGLLMNATSKLTHEALHGVNLSIEGIKTADVTPGKIGSLYRGQQLVMMGHYWGDGEATVTLSGKRSGEAKQYQSRFAFPSTSTSNPEVERLWAYAFTQELQQEIDNFGEQDDTRTAIVDVAKENGLVTNYTSMLVVRDEVFEQQGIKRHNRDRVAKEQTAQSQRAAAPIQSRRVDQTQPMYPQQSRSSYGGGALDVWAVLMLLPLLWFALGRRAVGPAAKADS